MPDGRFSTNIPGLPGGPLVTEYPIHVDLIPFSELHRPGRKASLPRRAVQHGNGNPNSSARGERNFLHGGAQDNAGNEQTLSYHATADDREVFVLVPADEVTFQAADGDGPGNENGFSCEMVEDAALWADPARRNRVIHVCADFMGRVAARLNMAEPEQHFDFNWVQCCQQPCDVICVVNSVTGATRHDCPDKLRHTMIDGRLAWDIYAQQWQAAKADESHRMHPFPLRRLPIRAAGLLNFNGLPAVTVAEQSPDQFVCIQGTTLRTYPNRSAPAGVVTPAKAGKPYRFGFMATVDGEQWLASRSGSWALASAFQLRS